MGHCFSTIAYSIYVFDTSFLCEFYESFSHFFSLLILVSFFPSRMWLKIHQCSISFSWLMVYSIVKSVTIIPIRCLPKVMVLFLSCLFMCLTNSSSWKVVFSWLVLFTRACVVLCACFSGLQLSSSCVFPCVYVLCTWVWSWWLESGLSSKSFMFW